MNKNGMLFSSAIVYLFLCLATIAHAEEPKKTSPPPKQGGATEMRQLCNKLMMPISVPLDRETTLEEALHFISKRYDLTIVVDSDAFKLDVFLNEVAKTSVQLKTAKGPLGKVLLMLLSDVQGTYLVRGSHATLQRDDTLVPAGYHVQITTAKCALAEIGRKCEIPLNIISDEEERRYHGLFLRRLGVVQAVFAKTPLDKALQELLNQTETNQSFVFDVRLGEKIQAPVTATLQNVPLDTAVRILSDMAGLKLVVMDNVMYITTIDNGIRLEKEQERRTRPRAENLGSGLGLPLNSPLGLFEMPGLSPSGKKPQTENPAKKSQEKEPVRPAKPPKLRPMEEEEPIQKPPRKVPRIEEEEPVRKP